MTNKSSSTFSLESVLALLDKIKTTFIKQPSNFTAFKNVWTSYLRDEIETTEVLQHLRLLFVGHSDLMSAFNCLLPPKFKLEDDHRLQFRMPEKESQETEHTSWNDTTIFSSAKADMDKDRVLHSDSSRDSDSVSENAGFDDCMGFVSRVQRRFQDKPEVFQKFLDILQAYVMKSDSSCKPVISCKSLSSVNDQRLLMESTVLEFEALFYDDPELLTELRKFIHSTYEELKCANDVAEEDEEEEDNEVESEMKDEEVEKDDSAVDIVKYGAYKEFAFFDEVQHQMGNEETYLNFLRCLRLFASNMISGSELINIIEPFVVKSPELMRQLKEMISYDENQFESISHEAMGHRKVHHPDVAMEIDYSSSKKQGVSYRPLPSSFEHPVCSSRTDLCNEVLNDTWVSFPLWSEDTTFGNSKITAYQEFLYRCEDERFELQIVIDSVTDTIKILEDVCEKIAEMTPEEQANFKLDDRLGGSSEVLQKKSIQRIYGDKANQIIDGLKEKPCIAVPIALRRLKSKTQDWKEHQERFNKCWKELNIKNYQKSLCNDASTFKQNDQKDTKTKNLLQEAEAVYHENRAQTLLNIHKTRGQQFLYSDKRILYDASVLMNHYLSHLPTVQNDDGFLISKLLVELLPRLLHIPSLELMNDVPSRKTSDMGTMSEMNEIYTLMYTSSDWYLFIRLHHKLYERLLHIRTSCQQIQQQGTIHSDLITPHGMKATNPYEYVLLMTECLVEGIIDNSAFEDQLRVVFESSACSMFALDRLLQNIMKQLQHITSDELNKELTMLFEAEDACGGTGGRLSTSHQRSLQEMSYWRKAYETLTDDCYKIIFYKNLGLVSMELMYRERPESDDFEELKHWTEYVDQYVSSKEVDLSLVQKPLFRKRNLQHGRLEAVNRLYQGKESPMASADNMQCQFNISSLNMVYCANSWDFFQFCSTKKHVSHQQKNIGHLLKHRRFLKWWTKWKHSNVTNEQDRRFREWLAGQKASRVKNRQPHEHSVMPHRQCKKFCREKKRS